MSPYEVFCEKLLSYPMTLRVVVFKNTGDLYVWVIAKDWTPEILDEYFAIESYIMDLYPDFYFEFSIFSEQEDIVLPENLILNKTKGK